MQELNQLKTEFYLYCTQKISSHLTENTMPIIETSLLILRCVIPVVLSQILQCTICMYYIYIQSETQKL